MVIRADEHVTRRTVTLPPSKAQFYVQEGAQIELKKRKKRTNPIASLQRDFSYQVVVAATATLVVAVVCIGPIVAWGWRWPSYPRYSWSWRSLVDCRELGAVLALATSASSMVLMPMASTALRSILSGFGWVVWKV